MPADNEYREAIYRLTEKEIMGYFPEQKLSGYYRSRLNDMVQSAGRSYRVILKAFEISLPIIRELSKTKAFVNAQHKFNYCLKIIQSNINEAYVEVQKEKEISNRITETKNDISEHINEYPEYTPEQKKRLKNRFKNLW